MPRRHSRGEWLALSRHGISGPSQDRTAVKNLIIHYTGGNTSIQSDLDMARLLARINDQYWESATRGYAIGYNWGCAYHNGDLWNIRDHDIRCGANGCQLVNVPYVAILVPTPNIHAEASDAQNYALRDQWIPELKAFYPNIQVHVLGHRDVRGRCSDGGGTACPGEPIYSKIRTNWYDRPGTTPPPQPNGDNDMAITIEMDGQVWVSDGVTRRQVTPGAAAQYQQALTTVGMFHKVQVNTGTATEQATKRTWATQIPIVDPTSDDAILKTIDANASKTLISVGPDLKAAVAAIPTTPGTGGGGMSEDQVKEIVNNTRLQVD